VKDPQGDKTNDPDSIDPPPRVTRHVQPVGPRVLVRVIKGPDRSESGLFLPQGVKDTNASALLAEVVEVARASAKADNVDEDDIEEHDRDNDEAPADFGMNVSGIPLGANVLFERDRGVKVPWDEDLRLLEVRHVLALVELISQDKMQ